MLDGGCAYVRCSAHGDEVLLTIYTDYPHEVIRLHAKWGTYGKQGDQPLKYVAIADMETEHLASLPRHSEGNHEPSYVQSYAR